MDTQVCSWNADYVEIWCSGADLFFKQGLKIQGPNQLSLRKLPESILIMRDDNASVLPRF